MIRFEQFGWRFAGSRDDALLGVDLRICRGEFVVIAGPSGSGKTTLALAMSGLLVGRQDGRPLGKVRVGGRDVARTPLHELSQTIALVQQNPEAHFATLTVRDEIAFGVVLQNADHQLVADSVWNEALFAVHTLQRPLDPAMRSAESLLARAGLDDCRDDHPYRLSWGQKRRLNLISAILHQPRLLLLDEPFAGQDWENTRLLLEVLQGVVTRPEACRAQGPEEPEVSEPGAPPAEVSADPRGACLLVTHDPRIVTRSCTRLLFVSAGRIALDAPLPQALRRLVEMRHDAFVLKEEVA